MRQVKIQISLRECAGWSESSLEALWIARDAKFLHADNEDWSDHTNAQTGLSLRWAHTWEGTFSQVGLIWTHCLKQIPHFTPGIYLKYSDISPYHTCPKIWTSPFLLSIYRFKIAGWVANSVNPAQKTRLSRVHTVCSGPSVRILRVNIIIWHYCLLCYRGNVNKVETNRNGFKGRNLLRVPVVKELIYFLFFSFHYCKTLFSRISCISHLKALRGRQYRGHSGGLSAVIEPPKSLAVP